MASAAASIAAPNVGGGQFMPLPTTRAYDSTTASIAQTPVAVTLAGVAGVPTDAIAVAMNVEVYGPTAGGYVRITPFNQDSSVASQEFSAGQAISNLVVVKLNNGKVQVHVSAGRARILMDVAGYYTYSPGSLFNALPTARAYDSGTVSIAATPVPVQLAGVAGVPDDATAVVVNTEVYGPTTSSYVRVTPFGQDAGVATQEFSASKAISNLVVVKLVSGKAQVSVHAGKARILMDVEGYFSDTNTDTNGATYVPLPTARAYDSNTVSVGLTPVVVTLGGVVGVPADATAVVVNTEVYQPQSTSYVRVTPYGQDAVVAAQEFVAGQAISNLVTVELVRGKAQVSIHNGKARILMDVAGYYTTNTPPPVDLVATSSTTTGITLGWTPSGSPLVTGQQIRRTSTNVPPATEADGTLVANVDAGVSSYADTGLTTGTTYSYTVFSEEASQAPAGSSVVTATQQFGWTAPQTIDPV
ncbi:MAG TPA: fibronectin type III domain-containing protein, partial [Jatrophihabitantaceae bacterium]|nr:fibronectin type III domain-containing protein [Jatrophihabitantaceae bacterium]